MTAVIRHSDQDLPHLPLIDIAGLRSGNMSEICRIADEMGAAARDIGFFRIQRHGIEPALIEAAYQRATSFFALPEARKQVYYIGRSRNHRGYVPFTEKGDYADEVSRNYEAFDLGLDLPADDPDFLAGNGVLGPNIWPDLPGFREIISRYYTEIANLGRLVCSALEVHLRLPAGAITQHMTKPVSQLRLLHYVRPDDGVGHESVNMGAHTDYECLTLLHTRNAGLQVMTHDDDWIDVPVDPSVYVVNIGDMLEAWTNGTFRSTPHRVLNLSKERFSMPYFVAANYHTEIRPFPQLIPRKGRPKYEPFLAGAHLERMLQRDFPYLRDRQRRRMAMGLMAPDQRIFNPFESRISGGVI
jgi:isopenicillin N synthase-like dioxygenase